MISKVQRQVKEMERIMKLFIRLLIYALERNTVLDVKKNLNNFDAMLSTIEDEQERYDQARSEILEKLDVMKDKAQCLENVKNYLISQ